MGIENPGVLIVCLGIMVLAGVLNLLEDRSNREMFGSEVYDISPDAECPWDL